MTLELREILWNGPYDWPMLRMPSPLDSLSGVYLWAFESDLGYVATGCGITRRSVRRRVSEHRLEFLSGKYTLVDIESARLGVRKEIWHGMWAGYDSEGRKAEFLSRQDELKAIAQAQMSATKIFVDDVADARLQQRMEAGIMSALYAAPKPFCDLPDVGMFLVPRRADEPVIRIINRTDHNFHNFPKEIEI